MQITSSSKYALCFFTVVLCLGKLEVFAVFFYAPAPPPPDPLKNLANHKQPAPPGEAVSPIFNVPSPPPAVPLTPTMDVPATPLTPRVGTPGTPSGNCYNATFVAMQEFFFAAYCMQLSAHA